MSREQGQEEESYTSASDLRAWAHQEIKDAAKAFELRTTELLNLVSAYTAGEISPEKADELQSRYQHRWGEALFGASAGSGIPDEEILSQIDKSRTPFSPPKEIQEKLQRLRGTPPRTEQRNR